jgi:hypothetical protein
MRAPSLALGMTRLLCWMSPSAAEVRRFAYIDRGFYTRQLDFQFFPREQVKVVKFEKLREEQGQTLDSIFSFLGLEPLASLRSKDRNVVPYERVMN